MFRKLISLLLVLCMMLGTVSMLAMAEETCAHSYDEFGNCTLCGYVCVHEWDADGWCALCHNNCSHDFVDQVCTICGIDCAHTDHTADGVCTNCGSVIEHSYTASVTTASTCLAEGVMTYTCSCGDSYTESIAATGHSYEATVTAPTCEAAGYTTYTCSCGDSYTADEVATTGHSYADGACSVCGAADPDYSAITVTAKSFSLSFEDEILVNFYYTVSDLTEVTEHGMLVFYSDPGTASFDAADAVYNEPLYDSSKDRYMATTTGIAAKEMGDTRYYVAYAKLSDGTYVYSTMYDYSPKKYSMNMLGKTSTSDAQKALCVAMLNYGAAAQTYFGYNTDNLMNAELTAEQQALVIAYDASLFTGAVAADSSKIGSFAATSTGFSKKSATVSFEGAFAINYYFTPSATVSGDMTLYVWTPETYASADVLTADNASSAVAMVDAGDGRYWADVTGIAAKYLDETYYVAAVYTDADGNTYCTGVIAYSLSKYCLSKAVDGNEMQELAAATAMYGYYAKLYFTT